MPLGAPAGAEGALHAGQVLGALGVSGSEPSSHSSSSCSPVSHHSRFWGPLSAPGDAPDSGDQILPLNLSPLSLQRSVSLRWAVPGFRPQADQERGAPCTRSPGRRDTQQVSQAGGGGGGTNNLSDHSKQHVFSALPSLSGAYSLWCLC